MNKIKKTVEKVMIIGCDCDWWKKNWTITIDDQDVRELNIKKCPGCEKPFKFRKVVHESPSIEERILMCYRRDLLSVKKFKGSGQISVAGEMKINGIKYQVQVNLTPSKQDFLPMANAGYNAP